MCSLLDKNRVTVACKSLLDFQVMWCLFYCFFFLIRENRVYGTEIKFSIFHCTAHVSKMKFKRFNSVHKFHCNHDLLFTTVNYEEQCV